MLSAGDKYRGIAVGEGRIEETALDLGDQVKCGYGSH